MPVSSSARTSPRRRRTGIDVYYNAEYVQALSAPQLDGLLVHEVLHAALGHVHRRGQRDTKAWNQAADVVVNGLVAGASLELPAGGVRAADLEHLSVEEVYAVIVREDRSLPDAPLDLLVSEGSAPRDSRGGRAGDPTGEPASIRSPTRQAAERHWAAAVERAAVVARGRQQGSIAVGVERAFDLVDRPKLDWRTLLWRFLTRTPSDFGAYDRRLIHRGLYVETLETIALRVLVCIDTSGSIDQDALTLFLGEIDGMLAAYPTTEAWLFYADAEAYGPWSLTVGGERPAPVGGGGTDFRPFFAAADEAGLIDERAVAVYLTDGFGDFPGEPVSCPVLWVVTPGGRDDAEFPFGEVVRLI